jgi:NADH-quinone oxidoreductase subunit L
MDLSALFSDPNFLPWLIPVGPLLAFLIITLITNRARLVPAASHAYADHNHPAYPDLQVPAVADWSRVVSIVVGMSGVVMAWLISLSVVFQAASLEDMGKKVLASSVAWMSTGTTYFSMGALVDPLTAIMLIMVPIAVLMIFIYSIGYMAHDARQARFFALISLFGGAMLTLVVADNLLLLFFGWEIMGLCSYLLIGFWFEKHSAYRAAIKAFMTTRVADVFMLLGIAYLFAATGTLNFREILYNPEVLEGLAAAPALLIPGLSAAALISVLLIIGTIGKSAQFPLHIWLPDAMEGPTPVSAMIHAAAMVSAGVYMLVRMYPLLAAGSHPHEGDFGVPLVLMSVVGAFTAIFASTIAVAQNDVKKVLAYSTISQLGFMVAALGIGAYVAATFHLITHAFFKALLFMAAGSVIHGMEHGEEHAQHKAHGRGGHGHDAHGAHDEPHETPGEHSGDGPHDLVVHGGHGEHLALPPLNPNDNGFDNVPLVAAHAHFDPQDMMNMGGLRRGMPVTFLTFLAGGLSLAGFPLLTAGFWSKDEILADAWYGLTHGYGLPALVFVLLALAAFLTAFYTMRQLGLTFWGEPRSEAARYANLGRGTVSFTMTLPLIILAVFAIFAGFVGVHPDFPIFGGLFSGGGEPPFKAFLAPTLYEKPELIPFNLFPVLVSVLVSLGGLGLGWLMYWRKPLKAGEPDPMVRILGPMYPVLQKKYSVDEVYNAVLIRPVQWISANVVYVFLDKGVIDGFLHLIGRVFTFLGDLIKVLNKWLIDGVGDGIPELIARFGVWFRFSQTGRVQQYMLFALVAMMLIVLMFVISSGALQAAP